MVYVCYDNGAYMNTGIQRSSATPMYADTTTTPVGTQSNGKMQNRKDLASIIADHDVPYVGQTTMIGNFSDLHKKAEKAIYTEGAAFLNIMTPCPRGWRYDTADIMKICKLAVETCYWPMFEVEHGKWRLTYEPKKKLPIEDFCANRADSNICLSRVMRICSHSSRLRLTVVGKIFSINVHDNPGGINR